MGEVDGAPGGVSPRARFEPAIAGIWRDVLGIEQARPDDDFFALGGQSLTAVQMLAVVEDVLLAQVDFVDFIERPTIAGLAEAVARARSAQPIPRQSLDSGPASGTAPCTFAQERLWFVDQLAGTTAPYNEPLGVRLRGPLDEAALEQSLADVMARHAALRTAFTVRDGAPVQLVVEDAVLELERVDLRGRADPEGELHRLTAEMASHPFDLERAPLVRACLLQMADEDRVLQLVFHHAVCDGRSHVIVLRELAALYRAHAAGEPPALPAPATQYPDFARSQRERLTGQALERAIAPWRETLADIPAALELPLDHPRPEVQSYRGTTRRGRIDADVSDRVRSFARHERVTPFMTLLAAFDVLLHRYSGQDTIMVGSAAGGRDRPALEDVVGLFVNTIALRNDLSGEPSFRELLGRVRRTVLDATAHQEAPFERLVAELQRAPDLSRHPIFQVFLAVRPHAALDLPGAEPFHATLQSSRVDLTLWVEETPEGYELIWEYSTDLFEAATIERLERHFVRLLRAGLEHPETSVAALPMLEEYERVRLLSESAAVREDFPVACMHTLFERQAMVAPDAPAVIFEEQSLSYAELNERANRLAHRLRDLGIGPESLVALFLERSFELVISILAVLKAGGAYVPLDPEYPPARVAFVLADTNAPVLLTHERLLERLPAHEAQVLCLDRFDAEVAQQSAANPALMSTPETLAYVIYTSGSTGQPKGVQVEHRQIARLFTATEEWYGFNEHDIWVLAHSYAFDVSVWELWGALAHGGRIVVSPFWVTRSPETFAALVAEQGVTVLCATPSLFSSVQEDLLRRADELAIRYVVFAGEALQPASLRPWFERFGDDGAALVNMYGITETTVHSTYRLMRAADCERDASPVGVPIPDLSLYLLDSCGAPVPHGVVGEIFVGGAGVTRGYLNRPELTAQRFLENPFGGGRLYRSGDLARRMPDGEIGFLGRMDDQVKVRGFRIELGEIQSVIGEHEAVADGAVLAVKASADDVRLAAYVVPDEEAAAPVRRLARMQLERRLAPEQLFELPDGSSVAHVNPAETEYLYEEIFLRGGYFQHGIELPRDACVFDVGANIGLFAMLVGRRAPGAQILAFEPMPAVHKMLALNGEIHGLALQAFDCALGASPGTATFTYFPHVTLLSGRYADRDSEAAMVRHMLANSGELGTSTQVDELLADRLESVTVQRPVRTISEILLEQGIERVDLLKLDAEKAELDVLAGIEPGDWPKIRQIVVEVHGGEERLRRVTEVLERAGFELFVEEDDLLAGSGLYNVFARRETVLAAPAPPAIRWRGAQRLRDDLRAHLENRLPAYMLPASISFLDELPLTTNGKLDRRSLPAPEWETQREVAFENPRTPTERRLAAIWQEVLGVERIGAEDSFFRLGGHSLLAARVVARVREEDHLSLSVRTLFERPTLTAFAAAVDAAPRSEDAPARVRRTESDQSARAGHGSTHPLSFNQEQLLFFDQLSADGVAYNSAFATRLAGVLDVDALQAAIDEVVRRHHVLHTALIWDETSARQVVLDDIGVELEQLAFDGAAAADPDAELRTLLARCARRRFDLAREAPLRVSLVRLGDADHVLLVQTHHVAFDARAIEVLYAEIGELYAASREHRPPVLPVLTRQYADFARWQRAHLAGERLDGKLAFWRGALGGAPTRLQLPTDHPRPPMQSFAGATFVERLDAGLAAAVRARCEALNVSPYMLLLAAFTALLYRRSGQTDILVGGPMANREQREFDDLIGYFSNTVVVRAQLAGNPTFAELSGRVRDAVLASLEHQDTPLGLVVDAVSPDRDPSLNPLFQVNFRVRVGEGPGLELDGLTSTPLALDLGLARFDLSLELHLLPDGIETEWIHNTDLFEPATVRGLAAGLQQLLRAALADPASRLLSLELDEPPVALTAETARRPAGIRQFRRAGGR